MVIFFEKRVGITLKQRLVAMHTGTIFAKDRLWHKSSVNAILQRDLLDDQAVDHGKIGHLERLLIFEIDLVLRRRHFVMRTLDLNSYGFKRDNGFLANSRA